MLNLTNLSSITTTATGLSNLILVSPLVTTGYTPLASVGSANTKKPPALLFHYEGEQTVQLQSDITDHYIEDNTSIQDQWALRPERVTTHGFIGELNDVPPTGYEFIQLVNEKLQALAAFAPGLSTTAQIAYTEAYFAYQTAQSLINTAVTSYSSINNVFSKNQSSSTNTIGSTGLQAGSFDPNTGTVSNNQNKQQIAFQQFYGYWRARTLFKVQTPWAIFDSMSIETLRAIQDENTRMITDFEITFKMIRTASTATAPNSPISTGRTSQQKSTKKQQGTNTPPSDITAKAGLTQTTASG